MRLKIYEDQSGQKIYDSHAKKEDIDHISEKVVAFFNRRIQLHIQKKENELTICCRIYANKRSGRDQGYYAVYICAYGKNSFTNFKKDTDDALSKLGLLYSGVYAHNIIDNIEKHNIIFNNIEKFDNDNRYQLNGDIDITGALINGKNLEYRTGKIDDIPSFCKKILELDKVKNIDIAISSRKNSSGKGQIEILIDEYSKQLDPTDITKNILREERERIDRIERERIDRIEREDRERRERADRERREREGKPIIERLEYTFSTIEKDINLLISVGYSGEEIISKIDKKMNDILSKIPRKVIPKSEEKVDKVDITNKTEKGTKFIEKRYIRNVLLVMFIIAITGLLLSSWFYRTPFDLKNMMMGDKIDESYPIENGTGAKDTTINQTPIVNGTGAKNATINQTPIVNGTGAKNATNKTLKIK